MAHLAKHLPKIVQIDIVVGAGDDVEVGAAANTEGVAVREHVDQAELRRDTPGNCAGNSPLSKLDHGRSADSPDRGRDLSADLPIPGDDADRLASTQCVDGRLKHLVQRLRQLDRVVLASSDQTVRRPDPVTTRTLMSSEKFYTCARPPNSSAVTAVACACMLIALLSAVNGYRGCGS